MAPVLVLNHLTCGETALFPCSQPRLHLGPRLHTLDRTGALFSAFSNKRNLWIPHRLLDAETPSSLSCCCKMSSFASLGYALPCDLPGNQSRSPSKRPAAMTSIHATRHDTWLGQAEQNLQLMQHSSVRTPQLCQTAVAAAHRGRPQWREPTVQKKSGLL